MQKVKRLFVSVFCIGVLILLASANPPRPVIAFCGSSTNDLFRQLKKEGIPFKHYTNVSLAVANATAGTGLIITADEYPAKRLAISPADLERAAEKKLRLYIEYPDSLEEINNDTAVFVGTLERAVVTTDKFGKQLEKMSLLGINDCHVIPISVKQPLLVLAKVAGFDKADYGVDDVKTYPLLFQKGNRMIALTKLTNFRTGRYEPAASWKVLWEKLLTWIGGAGEIHFKSWDRDVEPSYSRNEKLPANARREAVTRGVDWFYNARLFIDSSWKDLWLKIQGDGTHPFGPPVSQRLPNGDGSLGLLEGHASRVYYDGSQQYRYWLRSDVQGEVAYAMASAGKLLNRKEYFKVSKNLGDFIFYNSGLRGGPRNNKDSAVFGLLGWSLTHPHIFYGDDNARAVLGMIGASASMNSSRWDKEIVENILANFRLSGKEGFLGSSLQQDEIEKYGWKHFSERDLINPSGNFEAWMWAAYLWLYDKTKYRPLLEKAERALRLTMEAYPAKWNWVISMQLDRARMVLPLAWLVRVDDTGEHRRWLDIVVTDLLKRQDSCGAIREEFGNGEGMSGRTKSNKSYGEFEATLISHNGDKVTDQLYTNNFAFFGLNEAARATGNKRYADAAKKLSDYLIRIQVKSKKHPDVDGAWFRGFDYGRWDYWASNADAGWGVWSTLAGWSQTWIVVTLSLLENHSSYWESTSSSEINRFMPETVQLMFGNAAP